MSCKCDDETIAKVSKIADVPTQRPGFDALGMTAPMLVQLNPDGKWENAQPDCLDEEKLKAIVQHLINSNAVSAVQSYCCQCAAESQQAGGGSKYVPIIMMPIFPADQCPFDMDCEIQKMKDAQDTAEKDKKTKKDEQVRGGTQKKEAYKQPKKRGFVLQRLTDFDLLSQW